MNKEEAYKLMEEVHSGVCGPHINDKMLAKKILRMGYYWTTMESDCYKLARSCKKGQIFTNLNHMPPTDLHNFISPWPFSSWGIDIIGQIHPKASNGHQYILVAVEYFFKWVEATSYSQLGEKQVSKFVINNTICCYGLPFKMVSDNGSQFEGHLKETLQKYGNKHHQSSPYCPQTNGEVKAVNKIIKTILSKITEKVREWPEKLPYMLCGLRSSICTPTGATSYSLVNGMEPMLPVEVEVE